MDGVFLNTNFKQQGPSASKKLHLPKDSSTLKPKRIWNNLRHWIAAGNRYP